MAYYRDLREYLAVLEENGRLIRITRSINKDTEMHPLVKLQYRGLPLSERKTFMFENIVDSRGRHYTSPVVLGALAANREIYALGMACKTHQIVDRWAQVESHPIPPTVIAEGPVQEEVHLGQHLLNHGGLDEFPIPIASPGVDPSPFFTLPCWITKDPETGIPNVGTYRAQVKSPSRTGVMHSTPNKHMARHLAKCRKMGKPLEAAIVIGGPPSVGYVASSPIPYGTSELGVAGAIGGAPLELVRCKTVDIEVPAYAEIVIEGIMPSDSVEPEGSFGESLGYIGPRAESPYFNVTCITHRHNPIYLGFVSQYPPSESSVMRSVGREASMYNYLIHERKHTWVIEVACHETIPVMGLTVIKFGKTDQKNIWETLTVASDWAIATSAPTKMVVAVDEDINARDADSINWAISTRMLPHRDCRIVQSPAKSLMDPSIVPPDEAAALSSSSAQRPVYSCMLMNTTLKWPYPPLALPKKEFMDRALEIWREENLPPLQLKEPIAFHDLGFWPAEEDEEARMATKGDYGAVGERMAARRRTI